MSKSHRTKLLKKIQEAQRQAIGGFIGDMYLPMAIRFLAILWGEKLSKLISKYDNPSKRVIVWSINPGDDLCSFPEDLAFSLKTDFIEKFKKELGKLNSETADAINLPCDENFIKIVIFTPYFQDDEIYSLVSVGAVDIPHSKSNPAFLANYN